MSNRVKVARQININHRRHSPQHTAPDFCQGTMWRPLGSKSVGVRAKIRLEDSFEDQLQCPLHHAIADAGDLERAEFAVSFWDIYPAVRLGFVPACYQFFPHGCEKLGQPCSLDVLKRLAINARGSAVALGRAVSFLKGLRLGDMHEDSSEAMRLVRLRLSIDPPPQFLQTDGCLCHLTPASPWRAEYSPVRALASGHVLLRAHRQYCDPIRHPAACSCI